MCRLKASAVPNFENGLLQFICFWKNLNDDTCKLIIFFLVHSESSHADNIVVEHMKKVLSSKLRMENQSCTEGKDAICQKFSVYAI